MGMSIDEAITWLNTDDYESKGFADATSVAIETMRKYQKIEEIIDNWTKPEEIEWQIRKVLDNEKID
jgi:hypothetical protein